MPPSPEGAGDGPLGDAALVERARAGQATAFSLLVQRHQQAVRAFARRMGGGLAEADDLAQEAFVTAWTRLHRLDPSASFRGFVCGVVYRKALTARRGRLRGMGRDGAYVETRGWGETAPAEPAAKAALTRAMAKLPPDQRAAVALCLAGDFSHAEAATILGLPLGTVKSHVGRGRAKLLELMGGAHD